MENNKDDFWDIGKLLPKKRAPISPFSAGPRLAAVNEGEPRDDRDRLRLSRPLADESVETFTYTPEDNPLLLRVSVKRTHGGYSFYSQFRKDALRLFGEAGPPAPYTPFFSFTPQYAQLSGEQLAYYLYFRSEARRGSYIKADKGYFFLLVYEIINLPEQVPPHDGCRFLCRLWEAYRERLAGIDRYMIPWLVDYCLVYALPCPSDLSGDCLSAVFESSGLFEFFFGTADTGPLGIGRLLSLSSNYRWENSRALTEENRASFERHMTALFPRVIQSLAAGGLITRGEGSEILRGRVFACSLCSHNVRAELEIEYISLRSTEAFRRQVTLAVKYAENKLRAGFGIRARLSVEGILPELRQLIDAYFLGMAPTLPQAKKSAPPPPDYEKLYDPAEVGFSAERAAEIEAASWRLTDRLLPPEEREAFPEDEPIAAPPPEEEKANSAPSPAPAATQNFEASPLRQLLAAFLEEGSEAAAVLSKDLHIPLHSAAEQINEAYLSAFGDILLENDGEGYSVIPDYYEEATQWLKTNPKI